MSRRQAAGPVLTVIWWHDIPGQVVARDGERRHTVALPMRFERAIHRAAVGRGQAGTHAFVVGWRRASAPCSADLESEVARVTAQIDADFDDATLEALIKNNRPSSTRQRQSEGATS